MAKSKKPSKYVSLNKDQKEELRRLYQLANRRINQAFKVYEKEGHQVAPAEVTGGIQVREQWETQKYALSRTVKFESMKDYRERLNYLRSFERMRPNMTEYTEAQREKTLQGIETALGEAPEGLQDKLSKMSAPELSRFWKTFEQKAQKAGMKYSSDAVLVDTMAELYPEDVKNLVA